MSGHDMQPNHNDPALNALRRQLGYEQDIPQQSPDNAQRAEHHSRERYGKTVFLMGTIAVATLLTTTAAYGIHATAVNAPGFHEQGSAEAIGKAEIISVDMDMPAITLSTAKTNLEAKAAINHEFKALGFINIPTGEDSVTLDADVTTYLKIDPGEVNFSYDPNEKQLSFEVPASAFSTQVEILTDDVKQTAETGSLNSAFSRDILDKLKTVDGVFGTEITKNSSEMTTRNLLTSYDKLYMTTQVDKQCTPLIPTAIPNFTDELKENIIEAARGELLDPDASNKLSDALKKIPVGEAQEIVDSAKVTLPETLTFAPDESKVKQLKELKYKNADVFESSMVSESDISCGVTVNPTLTPDDGSKAND